jgi:hypothetical protein
VRGAHESSILRCGHGRAWGPGLKNCCAHGIAVTADRDLKDVVAGLGNLLARDRDVRAVVVEAPIDMAHVGCCRHRRCRLSRLGRSCRLFGVDGSTQHFSAKKRER